MNTVYVRISSNIQIVPCKKNDCTAKSQQLQNYFCCPLKAHLWEPGPQTSFLDDGKQNKAHFIKGQMNLWTASLPVKLNKQSHLFSNSESYTQRRASPGKGGIKQKELHQVSINRHKLVFPQFQDN